MKENLIVSGKGQITLPASMRKALNIQGSTVLTAERQGGRIVLTPAVVIETELYEDADVQRWTQEDEFAAGEREALKRKLSARKTRRGA